MPVYLFDETVCMAFDAPKVRNVKAQGNALGSAITTQRQSPNGAELARLLLFRPIRGFELMLESFPGRCPGL